jgi:transcriptional regulator with XRE-family HTH domain
MARRREAQLKEIRAATTIREEGDRRWRETIRSATALTLRGAAEAAGVSHTQVLQIRKGRPPSHRRPRRAAATIDATHDLSVVRETLYLLQDALDGKGDPQQTVGELEAKLPEAFHALDVSHRR